MSATQRECVGRLELVLNEQAEAVDLTVTVDEGAFRLPMPPSMIEDVILQLQEQLARIREIQRHAQAERRAAVN